VRNSAGVYPALTFSVPLVSRGQTRTAAGRRGRSL